MSMDIPTTRSFRDRMIGAAKLDPGIYEEVEADVTANRQAFAVVVLAKPGYRHWSGDWRAYSQWRCLVILGASYRPGHFHSWLAAVGALRLLAGHQNIQGSRNRGYIWPVGANSGFCQFAGHSQVLLLCALRWRDDSLSGVHLGFGGRSYCCETSPGFLDLARYWHLRGRLDNLSATGIPGNIPGDWSGSPFLAKRQSLS